MSDIFNEEVTFHQLGLSETVCKGVEDAGFKHPTDIQARLIPQMLAGKDVLGQAKTGTGKTAAFGLPLLQMIDPDEGTCALVLAPTRELAIQIVHELMDLAKHTPHQAIAIVGGESYQKQIDALKRGSSIVVGTPGRVMDLHQKRLFSYHNLKYVVLDEVDRMLDIGFREDIRNILSRIKGNHQTVFVSATISDPIEKLARQFMGQDVEKITTVAKSLTVSQVTQRYLSVQPWDKDRLTAHLLKHEEPALTVIFCRTKRKVDKLCQFLQRKKIDAVAIHGNLAQTKRNRIMTKLRSGERHRGLRPPDRPHRPRRPPGHRLFVRHAEPGPASNRNRKTDRRGDQKPQVRRFRAEAAARELGRRTARRPTWPRPAGGPAAQEPPRRKVRRCGQAKRSAVSRRDRPEGPAEEKPRLPFSKARPLGPAVAGISTCSDGFDFRQNGGAVFKQLHRGHGHRKDVQRHACQGHTPAESPIALADPLTDPHDQHHRGNRPGR